MSPPLRPAPADFSDTLLGSRARQQIAAVNWAATSLGQPETWPVSLQTVLEMMFSSRYPMCAGWGPDLTFFYNDAYAPFLGARHPNALGMPWREVWADIWDDIAPLIRQAMSGEATWSEDTHLVMTRNGYEEDTWWTFCYSPLRDESGKIAGFLDICSDSTAKVQNERRLIAERERLAASEGRLRALVNATSNVIFRMSADWTVMQPLDGRGVVASADAPMDRWLEIYIPEEDQALMRAEVDRALAAKDAFALEHRFRQLDGSVGWMASRAIPVLDANGAIAEWFGMAVDVTERRRQNDHLRFVVNELNHRVRNNLAMVQSIAMQTFRRAEDPEQASARFSARLVALARANDLLTGERGTGVNLRGVFAEAVGPHNVNPDRLVLDGPDVDVSSKSALALTLAAHELATNATKYGAWSAPDGIIRITWSLSPVQDGQALVIEWRERGGPPVSPPTRTGFGSRLIGRGLATELDGNVTMDFDPAGLTCRIETVLRSGGSG